MKEKKTDVRMKRDVKMKMDVKVKKRTDVMMKMCSGSPNSMSWSPTTNPSRVTMQTTSIVRRKRPKKPRI